jgi:quercetin dioxygenase-like cupin family protein
MQRRSFLSLAAGAVSAAACGQSSASASPLPAQAATPASAPIHPVLSHQDRTGEMHSVGYSTPTYKVLTQDTHGDLFIIEHANHQKGGPPRHLHLYQDEWFYVLEGNFIAEIGDKRLTLHPGDSVLAPRNIPHAWAYVGEGTGKLLISFTPAGKIEAFFNLVTKTQAPPPQNKALFAAHDMVLLGPPLAV